MGRPKKILPKDFYEVAKCYLNKEITNKDAASKLNMARTTFLKYVKEYKENIILEI